MKSIEFETDRSWTHRFWKKARRMATDKSLRAMSMAGASITENGRNPLQSFGTRPELVAIYLRQKK